MPDAEAGVRRLISVTLREKVVGLPDHVPLTTSEVSETTGVSESTLRKWSSWRRAGDLVPYAKRGGRNLYRAGAVKRWMGVGDDGDARAGDAGNASGDEGAGVSMSSA